MPTLQRGPKSKWSCENLFDSLKFDDLEYSG